MVLFPALFPESRVTAGPKHSTTVPFNTGSAVALSVEVKGPLAPGPNPLSGVAVKARLPSLGPQVAVAVDICDRVHRLLLPFTLQRVVPLPVTLHLKVMVLPGQVGGAAVSCPVTYPGEKGPWEHLPPPWVHKVMMI